MPKRLSSQAVVALQDALAVIYHYKKDLRRFLQTCGLPAAILGQIDWGPDHYKRSIISDLFEILLRDQDRFLPVLTRLCHDVAAMTDFPHLARLEDGSAKVETAQAAVAHLQKLVSVHDSIKDDEQKAAERRKARLEQIAKSDAFQRRLSVISGLFAAVSANDANPQQRGRDLEVVMRDLFDLFDLDPRASFRLVGEQIDGAFTLDGTDYVFEAKWEKEKIERGELDEFVGKLGRKLDNTLGLFLSMNGFQDTAVEKHSERRSMILLMEGPDLSAVLERRIDFVEMLRRKRRHAAQTGAIFLPLYPILLGERH